MCTNRRIKYVGFRFNPVSAVYEIPATNYTGEWDESASAQKPEPEPLDDVQLRVTVMALAAQSASSSSSTGIETVVPAALEQGGGDQKRNTSNTDDDCSTGADDDHHHHQKKKDSVSTPTRPNEKNLRLPLQTVHKMTAAAEQGLETPLVPNMWDVLAVNPRRV
jgi:hypothetical protein